MLFIPFWMDKNQVGAGFIRNNSMVILSIFAGVYLHLWLKSDKNQCQVILIFFLQILYFAVVYGFVIFFTENYF